MAKMATAKNINLYMFSFRLIFRLKRKCTMYHSTDRDANGMVDGSVRAAFYTVRKIDTESKYRSQVNCFRRKCASNWLHIDGIIFSLTSENYLSSDLGIRNCAWFIRSRSTDLTEKLLLHVHHIHNQSISRRSLLHHWRLQPCTDRMELLCAVILLLSIVQFKQNRD